MNWTLQNYCQEHAGMRPVLVGIPDDRKRLPVLILSDSPGVGIMLKHVPATEARYMLPVVESTTRDPFKRFRALGKRAGMTAAARAILFPKPAKEDWDQ